MGAGKAWTEQEIKTLREKASRLNDVELSKFIPRTPKAIKRMREKLDIDNVRTPRSSGALWSEKEDQFIVDNYGKMTYKEMAEHLKGRTADAIEVRKGKLNDRIEGVIIRKSSGKPWTKQEDEIVQKYYGQITYEEMIEFLPSRTIGGIQTRVSRLGFDRDPNEIRRKQRKHDVNKDYFKKPTVENCYVAGFLAADGCIHEDRNTVQLVLHPKDESILEEMQGLVGLSSDLGEYKMNETETLYKSLIVCGVQEWIADLKKHFNITPRKSLTLKPPNLTKEEHVKAFIRGYIDGDGSIFPREGGSWCIQSLGTYDFLSWIKSYFDKWAPESYKGRKAKVNGPHGNIYHYRVSGTRALSILQSLLEVDTPFLSRKWQPVIDRLKNQD